ncbi:MAG: hypothetical protein K8R48_02315 [Alphaproteobacteria bacterium]|nr:hypothetical protein [Alphaproteobacteria bacterium]
MANDQQEVLQALSDFKTQFEKAAKHNLDEVNKSNEKFLSSSLSAIFMLASYPFSTETMLLANYYGYAVSDLKKVEALLTQSTPDKAAAISVLQKLKADFDDCAKHPKEIHNLNVFKWAKSNAEFKGHSKKVDEILKLI